MKITLKVDVNDRQVDNLHFDVQTWLQMFARDQWRISETEEFDGFKLMTFEFRDALDAVDFQQWRDIGRYVKRT